MLLAGYNVSLGEYSLFAAVAVGSVANLVGSWIAYGIGYYGRVDLIEKHGHRLFIKKHHLEVADRWFERHGDATVFFTRMLPIVRTFISLPAGVARMPFWRFSVLTLLGCIPWMLMLTYIGRGGRRPAGALAGLPALSGLHDRRAHSAWRRLSVRPQPPAARGSRAGRGELAAAWPPQKPGCRSPTRSRWALVQGPTEVLPVSSSGPPRACAGPARAALRSPAAGAAQVLRSRTSRRHGRGPRGGDAPAGGSEGPGHRPARHRAPRPDLSPCRGGRPGFRAGQIEERLGSPASVAAAQIVAGAALWYADARGGTRPEQ